MTTPTNRNAESLQAVLGCINLMEAKVVYVAM